MSISIASFIAGLSCKFYDDLADNPFFKIHSTPFLLEFLKGIHTVLFTIISLHEPIFYIYIFLINIFHSFSSPASFESPYEKSCLYFFIVLFFFIKKCNFHVNKMEYVLLLLMILFLGFIEPFFFKEEYSTYKCIFRGVSFLYCFVLSFISSSFMKYVLLYFSGYTFCAVCIQCYSIKNLSKKIKKIKKYVKELLKDV